MIFRILSFLVNVYSAVIFLYCIFSWFPGCRQSGLIGDIYRFLGKIVSPYLNIFRKIIPPIGGTIDISPIVALLVLQGALSLISRLFIFY